MRRVLLLTALVVETSRAWQSLGEVSYGPIAAEQKSLQFRRSLYIVEDVNAGDVLTLENMRAIRPGFGLPPRFQDLVLGRRVTRAAPRGTPVTWDLL